MRNILCKINFICHAILLIQSALDIIITASSLYKFMAFSLIHSDRRQSNVCIFLFIRSKLNNYLFLLKIEAF